MQEKKNPEKVLSLTVSNKQLIAFQSFTSQIHTPHCFSETKGLHFNESHLSDFDVLPSHVAG